MLKRRTRPEISQSGGQFSAAGNSRYAWRTALTGIILVLTLPLCASEKQQAPAPIDDITGQYAFLDEHSHLAVLEEEGKLKGYVDVFQGDEESDAILSYPLTIGLRKKDQVEFKTGKIHQKYFRFNGTVERGEGRAPGDPDYLRLRGSLEVVTVDGETGEESPQQIQVVFKSLGKESSDEE